MGGRIKTGVVAALTLTFALAVSTPGAARDVVRYHSTISGPAGLPPACGTAGAESTPQLRPDPRNARHMVAVYLDHGGEAAVGARSRDGGRTWKRIPVEETTACTGGPESRAYLVNPYLDVSRGGDALFGNSFAGNDGGLFRYGVLSHRLPWAGGWDPPLPLDPAADSQDAAVAFDPRDRRRARYVWTRFDQVPNPLTYLPAGDSLMTATSTDGGKTFSAPALVARSAPDEFSDNPALVHLPDGSSVVAVRRPAPADLVELVAGPLLGDESVSFSVDVFRLPRDGSEWQRQRAVASATLSFITDPDSGLQGSNGLTDFAAGPGLLAFADAAEPEDGRGTIELTVSSDGGRSWKGPRRTLTIEGQAMGPAVAIGRRGAIGLLWTDTSRDRPDDDRWTADVWFAVSRDRGRTWSRTHLDGPMDLRLAAQPGVSYDGGPLGVAQDLTALGRGFGAAYTVAPPVAGRGHTDVRFARLSPRR